MTYDSWKATNPADALHGPEPHEPTPEEQIIETFEAGAITEDEAKAALTVSGPRPLTPFVWMMPNGPRWTITGAGIDALAEFEAAELRRAP